jgi:regulator of protease activity HflC (stomatin/prohibitin superfamily)
MLGLKRFDVKKNERAVLLRNGDFERVLKPGRYYVYAGFDKLEANTYAMEQPFFNSPLTDYLMANEPSVVEADFLRVEVRDTEVGLRYENEVLVEILPPATRKLFWKGINAVRVETVDIAQSADVSAELCAKLLQSQLRARSVQGLSGVLMVTVPDAHVGVLTINGKRERLLSAGVYGFWKYNRSVDLELIDTRLQALEVSGQEILTQDKVALRVNLAATYRYTDVALALATVSKPMDALYRELQFGLRAAVGTRSLDALLENKNVIDEVVAEFVKRKLDGFGMTVESVGVKDIILPGEMKTILAQVVEAEKSAQANVIRRREETSATRSLLNTAKVMEDNPVALRLKELETLERVAERIDKISVFGGLDGVLNALAKVK